MIVVAQMTVPIVYFAEWLSFNSFRYVALCMAWFVASAPPGWPGHLRQLGRAARLVVTRRNVFLFMALPLLARHAPLGAHVPREEHRFDPTLNKQSTAKRLVRAIALL